MTGRAVSQVYRIARGRGLTHEDAEDIAQEVFLNLWQRGKGPPSEGLLFCMARRSTVTFLRRELAGKRDRRRRVPLGWAEHREAPEAGEDWLEARQALLRLARRGLSDLGFRILRLRLEGSSYREIASRLGKSAQDVANHLHRFKERLRGRAGDPESGFIAS